MIHAPHTGTVVQVSSLSGGGSYDGAARVPASPDRAVPVPGTGPVPGTSPTHRQGPVPAT